ncbi:putative exonuclease GOR [Ditylenchus destructor]|uniref:Exonuclease GOR n=1 Tax=Ditylenchus destructor TaxID=166010 RepID=A0AAD4QWX6_9BILA|nr:putative exonuclease GOR [Ditylenchus destructor]
MIAFSIVSTGETMDKRNISCPAVKRRRPNSKPNQNQLCKKVDLSDDVWFEVLKYLTCLEWSQKCVVSRQINGVAQRNISRLPMMTLDSATMTYLCSRIEYWRDTGAKQFNKYTTVAFDTVMLEEQSAQWFKNRGFTLDAAKDIPAQNAVVGVIKSNYEWKGNVNLCIYGPAQEKIPLSEKERRLPWFYEFSEEDPGPFVLLANFFLEASGAKQCARQKIKIYVPDSVAFLKILIEKFLTIPVVESAIPTIVFRYPHHDEYRAHLGPNLIAQEVDSQGADVLYMISNAQNHMRISFCTTTATLFWSTSFKCKNSALSLWRLVILFGLCPVVCCSLWTTSGMSLLEERGELQNFYDSLQQFVLPKETLRANGYPLWVNSSKRAVDVQLNFRDEKWRPFVEDGSLERTCSRCREKYTLTKSGNQVHGKKCLYHWGKPSNVTVSQWPLHYVRRYSCCQALDGYVGSLSKVGCEQANYHVTHSIKKSAFREFVETTSPRGYGATCPGVYALDCEMLYTVSGGALARVSLMDYKGRLVLDEIVRPNERLLDSNYRFTGLTQADIENAECDLKQVREKMFQFVNSKTILIGHSLEHDLRALRVVHEKVVDTALVWRHSRGPNFKWSLRDLAKTMLNKDIQQGRHDSKEDALTCLELMKKKVATVSRKAGKKQRKPIIIDAGVFEINLDSLNIISS